MRRVVDQHQVGGARAEPPRQQSRKGIIGPDVGIHHQKRLGAEQRQRLNNPSGRLQRLGLAAVSKRQSPSFTPTEPGFELLTQPGGIHYDLLHAKGRQRFEVPLNQRFAAERQQGFGPGEGQRTHPLALARGQQQGSPGHHWAAARPSGRAVCQVWRRAAGTISPSNQRAKSASAGSPG